MAEASYRLSTIRNQPRRGPAARQEVRSDLERRDRPTVQLCRRVLVARSRMSIFAFRASRPARGGSRCHHVCKANPIPGRLESPQAYLFNGFTEHTKKWQVTKRSQLESGWRRQAGRQTTEDTPTLDEVRATSHAQLRQTKPIRRGTANAYFHQGDFTWIRPEGWTPQTRPSEPGLRKSAEPAEPVEESGSRVMYRETQNVKQTQYHSHMDRDSVELDRRLMDPAASGIFVTTAVSWQN